MEKVIAKITDEDLGLSKKKVNNPTMRYGARGIVLNSNGEIAVFYKKNKNEYKLPGGGIMKNECPEEAFRREILEETGCFISNIKKLGITIEEKGQTNFSQISHVFEAYLDYDTHKLHLTSKEQEEGGEVIWLAPHEAYDKVHNCINNVIGSKYDNKYQTLFVVKRDALILNYYLNQKKDKENIKLISRLF